MSTARWTALLAGLVDSAAIGDSRRMAQGLVALRAAAATAPVRPGRATTSGPFRGVTCSTPPGPTASRGLPHPVGAAW